MFFAKPIHQLRLESQNAVGAGAKCQAKHEFSTIIMYMYSGVVREGGANMAQIISV